MDCVLCGEYGALEVSYSTGPICRFVNNNLELSLSVIVESGGFGDASNILLRGGGGILVPGVTYVRRF